jgi:hypothetical protein
MTPYRAVAVVTLAAAAVVAASGTATAVAGHQVAPARSPEQVTAKLGAAHSLLPDFFGVNFTYDGAAEYATDPSTDSQLAALDPGTLRYPGGTNFFQWKLGLLVDPPSGSPCASSSTSSAFRFTLPDLLAAYKATRAAPVFVLNVMTSTLSCQISMLRKARQIGLPVDYVELGNELYLDFKNYPKYFPTASDYGATVARYVKALRSDFPRALVAAVGSLLDYSAREQTWNSGMLDAASKDGGLPDAITLHVYPSYNQALTISGLPGLFTEPYTELTKISGVLSSLPIARPVWLTEYNLGPQFTPNSNPAQTSYAQALFVTEMDLLLAGRVTTAQFSDFFESFCRDASCAYAGTESSPSLTPGGLALELVDQAAHGATRTRPIVLSQAPTLGSGGSPALIGQLFSTSAVNREVLVNLSAQAVTIKTGTAIPSGEAYEQVTFAGSPVTQVGTASALTVQHLTTGSTLPVPPYSIIAVNPVPAPRLPVPVPATRS